MNVFQYCDVFLLKSVISSHNSCGKRGHFMDAASPQNHLIVYNLGTTNAIKMKLTTSIYSYKIFPLV